MATTDLPLFRTRPGRPSPLLGALLIGGLAVVFLAVTAIKSPVFGVLAAFALLAAGLLVDSPRAAAVAALLTMIVCESTPEWGVPAMVRVYNGVISVISPFELLLFAAIVAVLLEAMRTDRAPKLPGPLLGALSLVLAAFALGLVVGHYDPTQVRYAVVSLIFTLLPLFVVTFLVANVVRDTEDLERAITLGMGLAIFKAIAGLAVVFLGVAYSNGVDPALTYYLPASNLFLVTYLFFCIACRLQRVPLPRWAWWGALLVLVCLVLSYRRTFWLGFTFSLPFLIVLATGGVGRRLLLPIVLLLALGGYVIVQTGVLSNLSGPVVERALSINPKKVKKNNQDRYRIAERRNVWAEIQRSPVLGLGVGVPWRTSKPLNFDEGAGLRQYTHLAVLWWWLKAGLLGVAAYVVLMLTGIATGIRGFRVHHAPRVRALSLAVAASTLTLIIVELASTVVGPDERGTGMLALLLGLAAAANTDADANTPRSSMSHA